MSFKLCDPSEQRRLLRMDERKRTYEPSDGGTGQLKRLRPGEVAWHKTASI